MPVAPLMAADGSRYPARMGSDEASHGCHLGVQVARCSYHLLPALVPPYWTRTAAADMEGLEVLGSSGFPHHTHTCARTQSPRLCQSLCLCSTVTIPCHKQPQHPVSPIWYQMSRPEMGRNPRHDNVPEGYCFPLAPLLQIVKTSPILLMMPLDSSCSCYRMARRRSPRPRSLVSRAPVSSGAKVVLFDSTLRRLTGEFKACPTAPTSP